MFTWDHGQLMEHFMAREAGDIVMENCQRFQLDGPALRVYIADSTGVKVFFLLAFEVKTAH